MLLVKIVPVFASTFCAGPLLLGLVEPQVLQDPRVLGVVGDTAGASLRD